VSSKLSQSDASIESGRLQDRLTSLGISLASASEDGTLQLLGVKRPVEQMLCDSPAFKAAVRQHWMGLQEMSGHAVQICPGVWLVALPSQRRRRSGSRRYVNQVNVAMLLGEELLTSEQFALLCDQNQVDLQATSKRIVDSLFTEREIQRLAAVVSWMKNDTVEVDRRTTELHTMSQQLAESYEELSLLYKLSNNMTVNQPPVSFLTEACQELQQVVGLRWMALRLSDEESGLNDLAGQMFTAGDVPRDERVLRQIGRLLMLNMPAGDQPMIVDDTSRLDLPHVPLIAKHLLVVSLSREGKPFGILFGGDKVDGSAISSVDSKLCSSLASSMSIFLQNMIFFEDMQAMFMGTLHALTNSIDAKDSYTHGHSERVALMARMLAESANLSDQTIERVYVSGLLHDVGKIGVPESVLCKPGRLTVEEFEKIKQHPEIGARILQDIKQMEDLIPGVLYHHERWDGRGYPFGLPGKEIPLYGRLIGLSDAFDAMSTNRTYRAAMTHDHVLDEIRRCAGTQFDPELADLFVKLDFEPFFELVEKHQKFDKKPA